MTIGDQPTKRRERATEIVCERELQIVKLRKRPEGEGQSERTKKRLPVRRHALLLVHPLCLSESNMAPFST